MSKNERGFTLIEVLISLALLVVISMAIYQATTQTYRLRDSLIHEGDFYNGIRLAMGVIERDVTLLYSPVLMVPTPTGTPTPVDAQDMAALMGDLGRQTKFWGPAIDKTGIRPSRFVGESEKMSFISASHVRVYKGTAETEFLKVTYQLEPDALTTFDRNDPVAGARMLVRTSSTRSFSDDDDRDEARKTHAILYGVLKLSFRYYRKTKDQWVNRWDSDSQDFKNEYPDIIEATLEAAGPTRLRLQGVYLFKPEVPLRGVQIKF